VAAPSQIQQVASTSILQNATTTLPAGVPPTTIEPLAPTPTPTATSPRLTQPLPTPQTLP
jgi:hypothetical protein